MSKLEAHVAALKDRRARLVTKQQAHLAKGKQIEAKLAAVDAELAAIAQADDAAKPATA